MTNTVGFAGPDGRYAVAVMYQLDPAGTVADGVHTVSDVVARCSAARYRHQLLCPTPTDERVAAVDGVLVPASPAPRQLATPAAGTPRRPPRRG